MTDTDSNTTGGAPRRTGALLLKGSAMQLVAFSANFFAGFLIMPFLIHHLGDRGYGFWALIGTIIGQLGVLDAGFMSTTQRFMANALSKDDYGDATSIFSTSMAIFWGIGTVVFIAVGVIALSASFWMVNKTELFDFEIALAISGLNLAMLFPFAIMQGALAARMRADAATTGQIVCTIIRTVLAVVTIKMGYGIIALAIGNFIASLAQRFILLHMMRRHLPEVRFNRTSVTFRMAKELFAFGKFVFLVNAGDAARYRLHNLIIAVLGGIAAVTHYSVAIRLADYFQSMVARLSTVSSPVYARHFTHGEDEMLRQKYLSLSRISSIICCIFASGAVVFGRSFLRLWLGEGYDDSYFALTLLMTGMFFALLQSPGRSVLRAIYKHSFDANSNLVEVMVNIALAVLLVPKLGIVGAAIGTAVPMVVVKGIVLPVYVCRTIALSLRTYYWAIGRLVIPAAAISVAVAVFLPLDKIHSLLSLILMGGIFSAVLAVVLTLALPQEDKASIINAIGRARILKLPGGEMLLNAIAQ